MNIRIETEELERALQGIYDEVGVPGKFKSMGDLEAIKAEVQQGLAEVRVERVTDRSVTYHINYLLTVPKRLTDLLDGLKAWQSGPGFVAFYGQRMGRVVYVDEVAPWPTPNMVSAAGPGSPEEAIRAAGGYGTIVQGVIDSLTDRTPEDIAREGVSATMDPNDPKRVLVTMPAYRVDRAVDVVTWTTRELSDIGYTARARRDGEYRIRFEAFRVLGKDDQGNVYNKTHDGPSGGITSDVNEAARFLHGNIKWDGCCDYEFDEANECMLHGCGREDMVAIGSLFGALYDLAAELMPEHAEYLAGKDSP